MRKGSRLRAWFFFILFQAFIGTGSGLLALSNEKIETYPAGTTVQAVDIGGLTYEEAGKKLEDYYDFAVEHYEVKISVNGSDYAIPYSDMDARFDAGKTLDAVTSDLSRSKLDRFITGEQESGDYPPIAVFNAGKLTAALEEVFTIYEKEPVPDSYRIDAGKLIYNPVTNGIRIDYDFLVKRISGNITRLIQDVVTIDPGDQEIFTAFPGSGSAYSEKFSVIVSGSSIPLGTSNLDEAEAVLKSLNGSVFLPGESIRLSDRVDLSAENNEGWRDMINRSATALYQAFLPMRGIIPANRRQSDIALPYSQAGLEAVITGKGGDLVLENETGSSLLLLGEIHEGSIDFYVVSPAEIPCGILVALKKDIVPPPVIYNVSGDLAKDETRVLSDGAEGYSVEVSRITGNDREELYIDHYYPVSRVVEIGGTPINTGPK